MFGLGASEILLILVAALILFGPDKLPEIGRSLGKAIAGFKKGFKEGAEEFKKEAKPRDGT